MVVKNGLILKEGTEANIWSKRDANGKWLRNEKLHSMYRSPNIVSVIKSRRLRQVGHVVRKEEGTSAFSILTGKLSGRPRRKWEDNIRMGLKNMYQYEEFG